MNHLQLCEMNQTCQDGLIPPVMHERQYLFVTYRLCDIGLHSVGVLQGVVVGTWEIPPKSTQTHIPRVFFLEFSVHFGVHILIGIVSFLYFSLVLLLNKILLNPGRGVEFVASVQFDCI